MTTITTSAAQTSELQFLIETYFLDEPAFAEQVPGSTGLASVFEIHDADRYLTAIEVGLEIAHDNAGDGEPGARRKIRTLDALAATVILRSTGRLGTL